MFVDKTRHVANLVSAGKYYFISRPRRFGKFLFLYTLKQAFLGRKDLFTGLYLGQTGIGTKVIQSSILVLVVVQPTRVKQLF